MRTTLNIKDDVLKVIRKMTGASTMSGAVNQVLDEFVRYKKMQEIKDLSGRIKVHLNWEKMEEAELKDMEKNGRRWRS